MRVIGVVVYVMMMSVCDVTLGQPAPPNPPQNPQPVVKVGQQPPSQPSQPTHNQAPENKGTEPKPELSEAEKQELMAKIKTRYGADEVIRDLDHIKHDLANVIDLSAAGQISTEETLFYFVRMHDFDDNNGLDGLELYRAYSHAAEHKSDTLSQDMIEGLVDQMLTMLDKNQDGILTYAEWVLQAKEKPTQ